MKPKMREKDLKFYQYVKEQCDFVNKRIEKDKLQEAEERVREQTERLPDYEEQVKKRKSALWRTPIWWLFLVVPAVPIAANIESPFIKNDRNIIFVFAGALLVIMAIIPIIRLISAKKKAKEAEKRLAEDKETLAKCKEIVDSNMKNIESLLTKSYVEEVSRRLEQFEYDEEFPEFYDSACQLWNLIHNKKKRVIPELKKVARNSTKEVKKDQNKKTSVDDFEKRYDIDEWDEKYVRENAAFCVSWCDILTEKIVDQLESREYRKAKELFLDIMDGFDHIKKVLSGVPLAYIMSVTYLLAACLDICKGDEWYNDSDRRDIAINACRISGSFEFDTSDMANGIADFLSSGISFAELRFKIFPDFPNEIIKKLRLLSEPYEQLWKDVESGAAFR